MKTLIVLSSGFPFDDKEPFLETELGFLSTKVDRIIVLPTDVVKGTVLQALPDNCTYLNGDFNAQNFSKFSLAIGVFKKEFWIEMIRIIRNPNFRLGMGQIKTALVSLWRAKRIAKTLHDNNLLSNQYVYYSFWGDDSGISLSLLKKNNPLLICYVRTHGWDVYFDTNSLHYLPYRWLLTNHLNGIFSSSIAGANYIKKNWTDGGKVSIIISQLGVPVQTQLPERKINSPFTLVSCSHLISVKRVHLIAEALFLLGNRYTIKWIHFGGGQQLEDLSKMVESATAANLEIELKGHTEHIHIIQWYKHNYADLFINVSESEGIPVSIMEAMSFGIPVIATNVGGTGELVNDKNGMLLSPDISAADLAKELSEILEKREQLSEMRKYALATVTKDFNSEVNYSKLYNFLFAD